MPTSRLLPVLMALFVVAPRPSAAQTVRVGLEVNEQTGGLFDQHLREALVRLDDVEPVDAFEPAHYVLTLTALCVPDPQRCDAAESYGVSVVLSEPLTGRQLRAGLGRTGTRVLSDWEPSPEAESFLRRFRRMHATWSASWDRDGVEASLLRLLRGIDARCFEKRRIVEARRAAAERRGDRAAADAADDLFPDGEWLC